MYLWQPEMDMYIIHFLLAAQHFQDMESLEAPYPFDDGRKVPLMLFLVEKQSLATPVLYIFLYTYLGGGGF